jgi:hypothetical protein
MWGVDNFFEIQVAFPLSIYLEVSSLAHKEVLFLISLGTSVLFFIIAVGILPTMYKGSFLKLYVFSFSLVCINCTRGFTVVFLHMHKMYFDQCHPLYWFFSWGDEGGEGERMFGGEQH